MKRPSWPTRRPRGIVLVFAAFLMIVVFGMAAMGIDVGYMMVLRTQLQVAADAGALAAANAMHLGREGILATGEEFVTLHKAGSQSIRPEDTTVELGTWDAEAKAFAASSGVGNAVRVTARRKDADYFFAGVLGLRQFDSEATAIAMANPREIAFVVDLSGSMNEDTEPVWSPPTINARFGAFGDPALGDNLSQKVFDDCGFGSYPGVTESIGAPLKVAAGQPAYADLTANGGPLTKKGIPSQYLIKSSDSEATRKQKAYSWLIDNQIAKLMPAAVPKPDSKANYSFWEKYLDNVVWSYDAKKAGRGMLPPGQDAYRVVTGFNNPNRGTFPEADPNLPKRFLNRLGYISYLQFMIDHGSDLKPDGRRLSTFSADSPDCPFHAEQTAGGVFSFPPREQPTHACRRAIIAAIGTVRGRNGSVSSDASGDRVAIITFERVNGQKIRESLSSDYDRAMQSSTTLQGVGDGGPSTATDSGLILARQHVSPASEGGAGREAVERVVILLTDGQPNGNNTPAKSLDSLMKGNPGAEYYGKGQDAYNAALVQAMLMNADGIKLYPVGIGCGADYDFMDRLARAAGTANAAGQAPRGTGNPLEYEQVLIEMFEKIVTTAGCRLVE